MAAKIKKEKGYLYFRLNSGLVMRMPADKNGDLLWNKPPEKEKAGAPQTCYHIDKKGSLTFAVPKKKIECHATTLTVSELVFSMQTPLKQKREQAAINSALIHTPGHVDAHDMHVVMSMKKQQARKKVDQFAENVFVDDSRVTKQILQVRQNLCKGVMTAYQQYAI